MNTISPEALKYLLSIKVAERMKIRSLVKLKIENLFNICDSLAIVSFTGFSFMVEIDRISPETKALMLLLHSAVEIEDRFSSQKYLMLPCAHIFEEAIQEYRNYSKPNQGN